jgi:hypothetical protein
MNRGFIYLITNNVNGKQYIGQTIKSIEQRFNEHKTRCNNEWHKSNMPISRAMVKYGVENFSIKELEVCSIEEIDEREIYYIEKYNTFHQGYNATLGGSSSLKRDIDEKKMLELYHKTKSTRQVAKYFGVDKDCIRHRIRSLGVKFYTKSEQAGLDIVVKKDGETIAKFPSKKECARWLLKNNIGNGKNVESVRRAVFNRNYHGYQIIINDKI